MLKSHPQPGNERFFASGPQRAAKVSELFGAIAGRYDLLNDLQSFGLHRRWKKRAVELACARAGMRALDVCCGTGDLAFALAGSGVEVFGLDFSVPMLAVARARQQNEINSGGKRNRPVRSEITQAKATVRNPYFIRGDAQQLPLLAGSFDIVTVGYGLRNLADWEAGLREMARVAKPGGRLIVLEFGKPENRLWRAVYFSYLRLAVPVLGLLFAGNRHAYAYILESLQQYPAQRGVAAAMAEIGLGDVRIVNFFGGAMSINYGVRPR